MSCPPPPRGSLPTLKAGCATSAALDDAVAAVSWSAWMTTAARPDPVARRMSRGCDGYGGDAGKCRLIRSTDSRQVYGATRCSRRAKAAPVSSATLPPRSRGAGAASAPAWVTIQSISKYCTVKLKKDISMKSLNVNSDNMKNVQTWPKYEPKNCSKPKKCLLNCVPGSRGRIFPAVYVVRGLLVRRRRSGYATVLLVHFVFVCLLHSAALALIRHGGHDRDADGRIGGSRPTRGLLGEGQQLLPLLRGNTYMTSALRGRRDTVPEKI